MEEKKFILFLHSGNYEKLYQAVMLAITAASMGSKVYIFLFFWALKKFATDKLDEIEFPAGMSDEDRRLLEAVPQGAIKHAEGIIKRSRPDGESGNLCMQRCGNINGTGRRAG